MNINLSSVAESPKTANPAAVEGGDPPLESEQSGGFFTKLAAFIKGESSSSQGKLEQGESSVQGSSEEGQVAQSSDGKSLDGKDLDGKDLDGKGLGSKSLDTQALATENQSSDELLVTADGKSDQVAAELDGEEAKALTSDLAKQNSENGKNASLSAEEIVSDNNQVLQRLDVSNKALQTQDGNALPQKDQADSSSVEHASHHASNHAPQNSDLALNVQASTEGASDTSGSLDEGALKNPQGSAQQESTVSLQSESTLIRTADGESVTIPASAERFIAQSAQQGSPSAAAASGELVTDAEITSDSDKAQIAVAAKTTLNLDELATEKQELTDADIGAAGLTLGAAALGSTVMANASTTSTSAQESDSSLAQAQIEGDEQAKTTDAVIPWATEAQLMDEKISQDQSKVKTALSSATHLTQQAAMNQASQAQLLTAAQSQAATPVTPAELTAAQTPISAMPLSALTPAQMQAMELASNQGATQDQVALKAMMGAKAAKLGQSSQNETKQGGETHSGFAQQLAQVAGQQNSAGLTQVRAEQVAQTPLTLNRELASEQVAERVQMMLSKNLKNIDIRLDPPELGRMQIRMQMNGDATSVHFTVANQQARDVIEQSMPRLREMLAQQGVQLGGSSVQQQASGQQQRSYADNNQGSGGQTNSNQGFSNGENLEPDINLDLNVAAKRDGISYYA